MPYLKHESGEAVELRNQQVLGDDSPLEFDDDGYTHVEDPTVADKLLAMHRHVEGGGHGPDETDPDDTADTGEFDAEAFVDRTPMSDVVENLETGEYDDHLDAIEAAEEADRNRDGIATAIEDRRDELEE